MGSMFSANGHGQRHRQRKYVQMAPDYKRYEQDTIVKVGRKKVLKKKGEFVLDEHGQRIFIGYNRIQHYY